MPAPNTSLLFLLVVINLIAFTLFGVDKHKARHDLWRIPEKTLFLFAILGGSVGAFLGMKFFRHKTKHKRFSIGLPLIFVLQLLLCLFILR